MTRLHFRRVFGKIYQLLQGQPQRLGQGGEHFQRGALAACLHALHCGPADVGFVSQGLLAQPALLAQRPQVLAKCMQKGRVFHFCEGLPAEELLSYRMRCVCENERNFVKTRSKG